MSGKIVDQPDTDRDFGVQDANAERNSRAERLRSAVKAAGGNQVVAAKAGVPVSTLGDYLAGGEMKLSNASALAEAAGVRLEWLATGRGPRTDAEAAQSTGNSVQPVADAATQPRELFSQVDIDRLTDAYSAALQLLAARGRRNPEPRRLMQVMAILYDEMSVAASIKP